MAWSRAARPGDRLRVGASHLEELVIHHEATVHHERDARRGGPPLRRLVHDAPLEPDESRPDADRLVHDRPHELAAAEDVHDVDRVRPPPPPPPPPPRLRRP